MKVFRRQNPLLAEMLLSLLFFSVCACIIICIFVSAYKKNEYSISRQEALIFSQNVAEDYKASSLDFDSYFDKAGWQGNDTTRELSIVFSHTMYYFNATAIQNIDGISGFKFEGSDGNNPPFVFRVEVITDE